MVKVVSITVEATEKAGMRGGGGATKKEGKFQSFFVFCVLSLSYPLPFERNVFTVTHLMAEPPEGISRLVLWPVYSQPHTQITF